MLRSFGRALPSLRASKQRIQRTISADAFQDARPWYLRLKDKEALAKVSTFRHEDYTQLTAEELQHRGRTWIRNDESVKFKMQHGNQTLNVRPFWVSVRVDENTGVSDLYISILPVDASIEEALLTKAVPQVRFTNHYSFSTSDRSSGQWRNYFVGLSGDLGSDWQQTLWPTWIFHENRYMWNVSSFSHLGQFLADPTKERIETHKENILALPSGPINKNFEYYLLERRWGHDALIQNNIRI